MVLHERNEGGSPTGYWTHHNKQRTQACISQLGLQQEGIPHAELTAAKGQKPKSLTQAPFPPGSDSGAAHLGGQCSQSSLW